MRMHLIEGGDGRTHNLPTMEEVTAAIPIKHIDRSFRGIVLALGSSGRNDSLCQGQILKSTFNVSARHMLHTCVGITYCYSFMRYSNSIEVYFSPLPSLLLLLRPLFLIVMMIYGHLLPF
ncbi:hypothetical protein BCV72DRAFT_308610 [Rhizopus microsporus var. microsporus]|uniref:Uncharacterized protein n=1 Tax=Rhizopus microsporus var. microsporus TaxID=86635 RepID=A0A1X0QTH9_RHIZD|nr:hypothetical protein BCV72DRAFT_308610 [Rhizopus microsporus var. microsporus]